MSRRISMLKRYPKKDFKYNNFIVTFLINKILKNGKKRLARRIVYKAFEIIESRTGKKPMKVVEQAIKNAGPRVRVLLKRGGKKMFPTPAVLNKYGSNQMAIRWLVDISRLSSGKPMIIKLSNELLDAYKNIGSTIKKKESLHRYAESNKSYINYKPDKKSGRARKNKYATSESINY